jgi:hypothetical protein
VTDGLLLPFAVPFFCCSCVGVVVGRLLAERMGKPPLIEADMAVSSV